MNVNGSLFVRYIIFMMKARLIENGLSYIVKEIGKVVLATNWKRKEYGILIICFQMEVLMKSSSEQKL